MSSCKEPRLSGAIGSKNDPSAPVLRREQKLRNQREARRLIGLPRYQACAMPRLQLDGITQLDHQFS